MVDVLDFWWSSWHKQRQYLNDCKLKAAYYYFELEGIAEKKGASVAHGIANELCSRLGEDYTKLDDSYRFPLSDQHPGYIIMYSSDEVIIKASFAE